MIFLGNKWIKNILKTLEKNGFEAYLVGGFVRDKLLGRKTNDIDIATNALPTDLMSLFGPPSKNIEYGSYNLKQKGFNIDITTYRIEKNYQNHKPMEIFYSCNLLEDAKRRDFTINALYENKNGQIIDPYQGRKHLKEHKLICIGDPIQRLEEDPVRILRALRFSALLKFEISNELDRAIKEKKEAIKTLSSYRLKKELECIFLANGIPLLCKYEIDQVLKLTLKNITYVSDISGIWAQIPEAMNYPLEKEVKNTIKKIHNILKCGTITVQTLYEYGLYVCLICADILKIERKQIERLYRKMPIKSREDLKISGNSIQKITNCQNEEINQYIKYLEEQILNGTIKNEQKQLLKALERRSKLCP